MPETFKEAFPEQDGAGLTPYNLWGVTISPLKPKDARVSVVLMKFLRARCDSFSWTRIYHEHQLDRNLNLAEAKDMFISTLQWRKSFKVNDVMKEKFPEDIFGKLGITYGKDKDGHPIAYVHHVPPEKSESRSDSISEGTIYTAPIRIWMPSSVIHNAF